MSFYKEGIEKTPIVGDMKIKPIGEMLQDKIHRLETENFELTKQNENLLKAYKEDEAVIEKLIDERNYIINNLKIDLNKKGVYSQAKGQISEILKYYKLNEKYIFNKSKEKKNEGN